MQFLHLHNLIVKIDKADLLQADLYEGTERRGRAVTPQVKLLMGWWRTDFFCGMTKAQPQRCSAGTGGRTCSGTPIDPPRRAAPSRVLCSLLYTGSWQALPGTVDAGRMLCVPSPSLPPTMCWPAGLPAPELSRWNDGKMQVFFFFFLNVSIVFFLWIYFYF